jgi:hypothetical protein
VEETELVDDFVPDRVYVDVLEEEILFEEDFVTEILFDGVFVNEETDVDDLVFDAVIEDGALDGDREVVFIGDASVDDIVADVVTVTADVSVTDVVPILDIVWLWDGRIIELDGVDDVVAKMLGEDEG